MVMGVRIAPPIVNRVGSGSCLKAEAHSSWAPSEQMQKKPSVEGAEFGLSLGRILSL